MISLLIAWPAFLPGVAQHRARRLLAPAARSMPTCVSDDTWEKMYRRLEEYKAEWGTADAVLGTDLGRWCATQRRQRAGGTLDAGREERLEALGLSWVSPSESSPDECDWEEMCRRLAEYRAAHGDAQVPKKLKTDPALGGWVAAVRRRGPNGLGAEQRAAVEAAGFEWVSTRKCGSSFMKSFRKLRDFHDAHGHCDVERVNGPSDELVRWSEAQRLARQKGLLSDERVDYLTGLGFAWDAPAA